MTIKLVNKFGEFTADSIIQEFTHQKEVTHWHLSELEED